MCLDYFLCQTSIYVILVTVILILPVLISTVYCWYIRPTVEALNHEILSAQEALAQDSMCKLNNSAEQRLQPAIFNPRPRKTCPRLLESTIPNAVTMPGRRSITK